MMLDVANEFFQSMGKAKHDKIKESPIAGPRKRVEPAGGALWKRQDNVNVQNLWVMYVDRVERR